MAIALMLMFGGIGLLYMRPWALTLYLLSNGILIYSAIASPGHFAQRGKWIWVLIFGVLILLAIVSVLLITGSTAG